VLLLKFPVQFVHQRLHDAQTATLGRVILGDCVVLLTRSVPCSRIYWDNVWAVLCSPSWTNPMAFVIRSFGSERPSLSVASNQRAAGESANVATNDIVEGLGVFSERFAIRQRRTL
jgi:hypothetical protein